MNLSVDELCSAMKGRFLHKVENSVFQGVSIDSRDSNLKNKIFFAIQGTRFDGHDFLPQAVSAGASALIIHKDLSFSEILSNKWNATGADRKMQASKSSTEQTLSETAKGPPSPARARTNRIWMKKNVSIIKVEDTLKALQNLAVYWRKKTGVQVIGITGSSGKTTTKIFCFTLLNPAVESTSQVKTDSHNKKNQFRERELQSFTDQQGGRVIASPKSFNNVYGVSLTLLSATEKTDIVIQEMGMNQKGEINILCELAQPDVAAVTQVGDSHIGMLGSKDNIAREKEKIYLGSPKAIKVFNWDDPYTKAMYKKWKAHGSSSKGKVLRFSSRDETADVFFQIKEVKKLGLSVEGHIQGTRGFAFVPVVGPAHLNNVLVAASLALAIGVKESQIWERLSLCRLPPGRNQWVELSSGAQALFDAYNASPESISSLLEYFLSPVVEGKKILILGDFLELGSYLQPLQKKIAMKLAESEVSVIWLIGSQASAFVEALKSAGYSKELYFSKYADPAVAHKIHAMLDSSVSLAFKGSRRMRLEMVLKHFHPLNFSI